ncbi:MAG TPA: hypothetical protein VI320_34060 [Terracidiphilus sp.]|jgi:hypothetical protein
MHGRIARFLLPALLLLSGTNFAQTKAPTLRALYVEDQRDRGVALADDGVSILTKEQADKLPSFDWEQEVPKRDEARREQARTLLAQSALTGEDYFYAAYLFQHGESANDNLFAHILGAQAIALGYTRAKWNSAAALDRYLQKIGQKQVFGTQYVGENLAYYLEHQHDADVIQKFKALGDQQTLEPYAPQIVPDTIRTKFCVPRLAAQQQHIADVKAGKAKPEDLPRLKDCTR